MKKTVVSLFFFATALGANTSAQESLFTPDLAATPVARDVFAYIDENKDNIIEEWISLTEIPAPSGHEQERGRYFVEQFEAAGLDEVYIDEVGNVVGVWRGSGHGEKIVFAPHMDTVFQDLWEIDVVRDGNILKAPGIGDNTASCINLLWTLRALKHAGFEPVNDFYFLVTVGEEMGKVGMKYHFANAEGEYDKVIALDGGLGGITYGAFGFGGREVTFRGPGAHTLSSKGVPNPNMAMARAIEEIYLIPVPAEPRGKWTVLNVGLVRGGRSRNAVSQETTFYADLRSHDQVELERAGGQIDEICYRIAEEEGVEVEISRRDDPAAQIPDHRNSTLVKTAEEVLRFLGVEPRLNAWGVTDANIAIRRGISAISLGRTRSRGGHTLQEEAEIDGLFVGMKQVALMFLSLNH
jgi:acetylornithine deacetylase/succinyl-diaminopimelate desuccinylase-like protein